MEFLPMNDDDFIDEKTGRDTESVRIFITEFILAGRPDATQGEWLTARARADEFASELEATIEQAMRPLRAALKLAREQIVSFDDFDDEEYSSAILQNEDLDNTFGRDEHAQSQLSAITERICEHERMGPHKELCQQTIGAYENGSYDLAVLGLFAIIDGLLSELSEWLCSVSIMKRVEKILNLDNNTAIQAGDRNRFLRKIALYQMSRSIGESSDFDKVEPDGLNRHWSMHGRSQTKRTKSDCDKLIRYIYALLTIDESKVLL